MSTVNRLPKKTYYTPFGTLNTALRTFDFDVSPRLALYTVGDELIMEQVSVVMRVEGDDPTLRVTRIYLTDDPGYHDFDYDLSQESRELIFIEAKVRANFAVDWAKAKEQEENG